jgi:hypothetical protein
MDYAWTCQCCGKQFNNLPLDFACKAPDHWFDIPEAERATRGKLGSDVCKIDDTYIFVRGCLEIPVVGIDDNFRWGVWVSVSKQSFKRIDELWNEQAVENEPPFFGWLCNALKPYPSTLSLKTNLHLRSGGIRPSIELQPTDHPLAIEQRQGITLNRVEELAAILLPRH